MPALGVRIGWRLSLRLITPLAVSFSCGCAATYESACHELSVASKGQLNRMSREAARAEFQRHVVLLETGSGMTSKCRSHYINTETRRGMPESLLELCQSQSRQAPEHGYCLLYLIDGKVVKRRVY